MGYDRNQEHRTLPEEVYPYKRNGILFKGVTRNVQKGGRLNAPHRNITFLYIDYKLLTVIFTSFSRRKAVGLRERS